MTGTRIAVLFVCIHNSARSQMAEAFLNQIGDGRFAAESAGIEPGVLNPVVVEVMKEAGIDISGNVTKSVHAFLAQGRRFDLVVTVCDETAAERCPVFPGAVKRLHWGFPDPSAMRGDHASRLAMTRTVRDQIRDKIASFVLEESPVC